MPASFFRRSLFPGFGLLLALATVAQGQEAALRLDEALARAVTRNPGLLAHTYAERAAEALIEQAALPPVPTLEIEAENFAGTGALRGVRGLEATVQASQAFERGGKRAKRVSVANRERETAAQEYAVRRAEVLSATAVAFVETLVAQQRVIFANEPLRLAREIFNAADGRVKAGAASPAESARARAALAAAQADLARAQAELITTRTRLAATWSGSAAEISVVAGSLRIPDALPTEAVLREKLSQHPRLGLQKAIVATRRAALDLEQAQTTQDVTVGGGVQFLRDGSDAGLVAGISIPLPTRNRNQGNIRAARETLAGAEQTIPAIESELRTQLTTTWQEASTAHAAAQNLRREALPPTEEAHAIVRRAYEEGQLPLIDVLDAQRALIGVRRELLELEAAFALAYVRAEALADGNFPATTALLFSR